MRSRLLRAGLPLLALNALLLWKLHAFLINPDGVGYFVYLPALLLNKDLWLGDLFRDLQFFLPQVLTDSGLLGNPFPIGTALFWLPCVLAVKALLALLSSPEAAGLLSYRYAANWASMLYGIAAALLAHDLLRRFFSRPVAGCLIAFLGSPLFYYVFWDSSASHAVSAFCASLQLWAWARGGIGSSDPLRWALLGVVTGLAATVRLQDAAFAAVLAVDAAALWKQGERRRLALSALAFSAGLLAGFFPQMLLWRRLYGSWLANPQMSILSLQWPKIQQLLFSPYHGLLVWTPAAFLALIGLIRSAHDDRRRAVAHGLILAFAAQLLILGFDPVWSQGYSFGLRRLTSSYLLFAFGAASLWETEKKWLRALLILCSLWSVGLALAGSLQVINFYSYYSLEELFEAQKQMLLKLRWSSIFNLPEAPHRLPLRFLACLIAGELFWIGCIALPLYWLHRGRFGRCVAILLIYICGFAFLIGRAKTEPPPNFSAQTSSLPIVSQEEFVHHIRLLNDLNLFQYSLKAGDVAAAGLYLRRIVLNPAQNPLSRSLKEVVQKNAWPLQ